MSDADSMLVKHSRDLLNASGYLFQLRVQAEVESGRFGWDVAAREYPWFDPVTEQDEYIDLILERGELTFIVECKKVAEKTIWAFPVEDARKFAETNVLTQLVVVNRVGAREVTWRDIGFQPASPEAAFCGVHGMSKERPPLERTASQLIRSLEDVALSSTQIAIDRGDRDFYKIFTPVIVTTATLTVCEAHTGDIQLDTGKSETMEFREVEIARFKKSLAAANLTEAQSLRAVVRGSERTVLIVNSAALGRFLQRWTQL